MKFDMNSLEEFRNEVSQMPTADIMLILDDQLDLYNSEEIAILREELSKRPPDAIEREEFENDKREAYIEEQERIQRAEQLRLEARQREEKRLQEIEQQRINRINNLKESGADGFYQYKVLSSEELGGAILPGGVKTNTLAMTYTMNELGIDGWHLITTSFTNKESLFVFERFIRF